MTQAITNHVITYQYMDSPVGTLRLVAEGDGLCRIEFPDQHGEDGGAEDTPLLRDAASQLREYFSGERQAFELPLAASGTEFQHSVWTALSQIPYGELRSYRDIAEQLGKPKAVRAVGAANGRNPLPIVVPCHRVIGSNGSLTGFAGGLPAKQCLLELEGVQLTLL